MCRIGEEVASFDAAMDALRQSPSPVPVVFHRAISETSVGKESKQSVEEEEGKLRAAEGVGAEKEGAKEEIENVEEEMETRPDRNWRIVHIG